MPWFDPPLRAPGMETLADGEYEGTRWWLQRLDGLPNLQLTVSGYVDSNPVVDCAEFVTADPATVQAWLARMMDRKRAGWARKARMAVTAKRDQVPERVE